MGTSLTVGADDMHGYLLPGSLGQALPCKINDNGQIASSKLSLVSTPTLSFHHLVHGMGSPFYAPLPVAIFSEWLRTAWRFEMTSC